MYTSKVKDQKRTARIILNADIDSRSKTLFHALEWLMLHQEIKFNKCAMMYKIFNESMPSYLQEEFTKKQMCSAHNLRSNEVSRHMFEIPVSRTELLKNTFVCSGASMWNSLPESVKVATSFKVFKNCCKEYILS